MYEHGDLFGFKRPLTPVKLKRPTPFMNLGPDLPVFKSTKRKVQKQDRFQMINQLYRGVSELKRTQSNKPIQFQVTEEY